MIVFYIVLAILLFGLLIFVHEFGHFITAKLFGVRVNEFSMFMGPAIWKKQKGETLYAIRAQGYTPILAHVERYPFVTEDPTLLYNWVCDGCLAQINATGLIRDGHTAKWLHKLIEWNLVHILCSDCHHPVKRPPNLAEGFAHLPDKVARRMQRNAIDIYLGDDLRPPEPTKPVYRFGRWV